MHRASTNVRPKQTVAAKAAGTLDSAVTADGAASSAVWAAAVLGIAAAWVAAGSTGLLAHGLRHAITWVLLFVAAALAWPAAARWREKAMLLLAAAATVALTASTLASVNVLAVSLFVAAFAAAHVGAARAMLLTAGGASGALALFQIGQSSVASFWQASDAVAGAVGFVGGKLAGEPVNVGSTFAGLDYLVVVFAVLGVLGLDGRLRIGSLGIFATLAVLGHLGYLAIVAHSEQIVTAARTARNERLLATYFAPASRAERESLVGAITFKAQGPGAGALSQGASDAALAMQAEEQKRLDRELAEIGLTRSEIDEIAAHVVDRADFPESLAPATRTALFDRLKPNLDALEHRELDLPGRRAPYTWDGFVLAAVPWNLPAVALLFHAVLIAVVLWWAFWPNPLIVPAAVAESGAPKSRGSARVATPFYRHTVMAAAVFVLSLLAAGVVTYSPGPGWHEGKKIVAYEKGFLNWLKADYGNMRDNMNFGRLSVGMYGMFGPFVESLGMDFARSKDLAEEDLADADALVLFYPNRRWKRSQVDRIVEFVERGGSLLVAGEHTIHEGTRGPQYPDDEAEAQLEAGDEWVGEEATTSADAPVNRVNDLLEHFGMRIAFDSAEFAVGGWLQSYGAVAHPTTTGLRDERNVFGAVVGASVEAPAPAVPMIIGRYGIGDGGDMKKHDVGSYMGDSRYNGEERLGDIVLAAEKRVGAGRVIVFGDTSSFTNNLTVSSHPYTARLLAYLAAPTAAGPQAAWRQAIAWALLAAALGLLLYDRRPMTLVALSGGLACGIWLFSSMTAAAGEVLPTGQFREPNNVAYIDTSHHGAHSDESLRDDGLMGLTSMLVRHEYLALQMSDFSGERLMDHPKVRDGRYGPSSLKARLVVSIAPQREYSEAECDVIDEYIARGGRLILTVGADDAGPARRLLERFEMRVGAHASPLAYGVPGDDRVVLSHQPLPGQEPREPTPLGHFKSGYTRVVDDLGEYEPFVRFHAGWPIVCGDPRALVISRYAREEVIDEQRRIRRAEFPLIVIKRHGLGLVAVIGDSGFAMNKNLERTDGLPIEGLRENAFFWRWFLDLLEHEVNRWMPLRQVPAGSELDLEQGQPPASDELDLRKKIEDLLKIPELKITPPKPQPRANGTPPMPADAKAKADEPPQATEVKSDEKDGDRKSDDRKKERVPRDLRKAGERGDVRGPLLQPPAEEKEGEKKEGEHKDAGASGEEEGK